MEEERIQKKQEPKRQSREGRFRHAAQEVLDAVAAAREDFADAASRYQTRVEDIEDALDVLRGNQNEYEDLYGHLDEDLHGSDIEQNLEKIMEIDLELTLPEFIEPDLSEVEEAAQACLEAKVPPLD